MNHQFDIDHAKSFGIVEAILINNLQFWITKNRANKRHQYEGRTWTYNSVSALSEMFPYLSAKQIRGALDRLVSAEVLLVGHFNEDARDRTNWYAFVNEDQHLLGRCIRPAGQIPFAPEGKSLIDTDKNTDSDAAEDFIFFWSKYPKKVAKPAAIRAWKLVLKNAKSNSPVVISTIHRALDAAKRSEQWTKEGGKYIPNPATWLNQERWNDHVDGDPPPTGGGDDDSWRSDPKFRGAK